MTLRAAAKRVMEATLGSEIFASAVCQNSRPRAILAYHNVIPDDSQTRGDPSLHIELSRFIEQIEWLAGEFEIVALPDLLTEGHGDRPRLAVTFDDAYVGAVSLAMPALASRGIPATLFVCTGFAGGDVTWWDLLADRGGLSAATRTDMLDRLHGKTARVLSDQALSGSESGLPRVLRIASTEEISRALQLPGMSVGSHTVSHPNLASLSRTEVRTELAESRREVLRRWPERATDILAYPYGLASVEAAEAARETGYGAALLGSGGLLPSVIDDRFAVPRFNVPAGMTPAGVRLRMMGFSKWWGG